MRASPSGRLGVTSAALTVLLSALTVAAPPSTAADDRYNTGYPPIDTWVRIKSEGSHKCMTVEGDSAASGARIVQAPCDPSRASQRFRESGDAERIMTNYGKCLNVADNSSHDGAFIIQWDCGGYENEKMYTTSGGVNRGFRIGTRMRHPNPYLQFRWRSDEDGQPLVQYTRDLETPWQKWFWKRA
ncbi:RICIN domain-containing protein [Rhizohabitans arisaemae]|uniref:RICIN domain-containing protein n=1 Tax=Rhizohabitans arisaemae TaxID=2720610 RepID=UPI0024B25E7E|nr:RICIN domain-containing protein [Rhizohabitans arisaemae]